MRALACATAPSSPPLRRRHFEYQLTDLSALGARVQSVNAPGGKAPEYSRIGQADLEQARALLSRARNDLEPQHWALLDRKLSPLPTSRPGAALSANLSRCFHTWAETTTPTTTGALM